MTICGLTAIATVSRLINLPADTIADPFGGVCRVLPREFSVQYEPDTSQEGRTMTDGDHSREVEERYLAIKDRVWRAAEAGGREPAAVKLVAVTKTFEAEDILPVLRQGHRYFGENRVQEAMHKWPPAPAVSRNRAASDRAAADEQGARGGGVVRLHRDGGPAEARGGACGGAEAAKPRTEAAHAGEHRP